MTQSRMSSVITVGIATLLIAGCSDNKSTTGVSLSKEATACYSEYVDLHDDIRKAFDDQAATGTTSKAEFGKKHYEALGGEAGRALPQECADLLKFSMNCYDRYVDTYPDLIEAWQASGQPKSVWGKTHYENHGKLAGRDFPGGGGCSYEYVPPTYPCPGLTNTGFRFTSTGQVMSAIQNLDLKGAYDNRPWDYIDGRKLGHPDYGDVRTWDIRGLTSLAKLIANDTGPVGDGMQCWDTSNITNMDHLFYGSCSSWDLSKWDVSKVTSMKEAFKWSCFNHDISGWDVSRVTSMKRMFMGNNLFDQDISGWNVSRVTDCSEFSYLDPANFPVPGYFEAGESTWSADEKPGGACAGQ